VWRSADAPEKLRRIGPATADWMALIPFELASKQAEELFLRWATDARPIFRLVLDDRSVLLAGNNPPAGLFAEANGADVPLPRPVRSESSHRH
jgi:hypothetical protein